MNEQLLENNPLIHLAQDGTDDDFFQSFYDFMTDSTGRPHLDGLLPEVLSCTGYSTPRAQAIVAFLWEAYRRGAFDISTTR